MGTELIFQYFGLNLWFLGDFGDTFKNHKIVYYIVCKFYAIHRGDYEDRNEYVNFPEDGDILII